MGSARFIPVAASFANVAVLVVVIEMSGEGSEVPLEFEAFTLME